MNEWTIYWITRADNFCFLFELFAILSCVFIIIFIIAWTNEDKDSQKCKRSIINCGLLFLFFLTIRTLIPTTKEMLLIKGVPAIVNSKETGKLRVALNKLLDEYINKDKEKEKK